MQKTLYFITMLSLCFYSLACDDGADDDGESGGADNVGGMSTGGGASTGGTNNMSGDALMCGTVCGGDFVGTWNAVDLCTYGEVSNPIADICPTGEASADLNVSGSVTINADGTFSREMVFSSVMTINLPATCLNEMITCGFISQAAMNPEEGVTASCEQADETSPCVCTFNRDFNTASNGSYVIDGNSATFTDDPASPDGVITFDYCVQNNSMIFIPTEIDDSEEFGFNGINFTR